MTTATNAIDVAISSLQLKTKPQRGNSSFWNQFNGSFVNRTVTPLELADEVWQGHAFTSWLKKPWRNIKNYDHAQTIGLDFDTGDSRSDPNKLYNDPFTQKYGSFIYTTFSHTEEMPRCRVVFVLDTPIYQPRNFSRSASSLIWLYGGVSDRASKDPVRGFFGGPPGETDAWWIGNVLPIELLKQNIKRYEYTGSLERRAHGRRAKYRAKNVTEREIIEALNTIDPWGIDYDDWVHVLMAIHSALPNEAGLAIAERWGQGEGNEIAARWKGFNSSRGLTVATLFDIAKKHGWHKPDSHIM